MRLLDPAEFAGRLVAQAAAQRARAGDPPLTDAQSAIVVEAAPLVQERVKTLDEGVEMLGFLLVDEASFAVDETAAAKQLGEAGQLVLAAAVAGAGAVADWTAESIEAALRVALIEGLGLKPRQGVRAGPGGDDRAHGLAAAVRVDGAARTGASPPTTARGADAAEGVGGLVARRGVR